MAEVLPDYEAPAARPTFITVLCILTFIGSGWGLIGGAIQYFSADKQALSMSISKQKVATDMEKSGKNDAGTQMAEKMVNSMSSAFTAENIKKTGIASIVGALFCLGGAFLMWQLKRNGFFLYIAGTLIGIISPIIIYGTDNLMSIITSVMVGFLGIVFVILYGVNMKHMK